VSAPVATGANGNLASDGFDPEMLVWFCPSVGDWFQLIICRTIDLVEENWILRDIGRKLGSGTAGAIPNWRSCFLLSATDC
jgi:hypothetical protein